MADRIHPGQSTPPAAAAAAGAAAPSAPPSPAKPSPPPGTYVVQIPKDQIYRYPPPENARRYQKYSRRSRRSCGVCCCLCWTTSLLFLLLLLLAAAAAVLYLVFRPKATHYSIDTLSIRNFNLSAAAAAASTPALSPEFDVAVRADNPNGKIGVYYRPGSAVAVSYSGADLCVGALPAFYQPRKNVTVFKTVLVGKGIRLSRDAYLGLMAQQRTGEIPLGLNLRVPVRVKFGSVKTWTVTVKVRCDVVVDKLAVDASVVSNKCRVRVLPWK